MSYESAGVISQYLLLIFIIGQVIVGVIISITTAIVSFRLTHKHMDQELKENKEDHKELKQDLKEIHAMFGSVVSTDTCAVTRADIHKTFCAKIDDIKSYMKDMDQKREQARIQMDRLVGKIMRNNGG